MASGYALPTTHGGSHYHGHGHSHSYSDPHLSPNRATSDAFPRSNGGGVKKAASNRSLYTHAETSRENTPSSTPLATGASEYFQTPFEHNTFAFEETARAHSAHTHGLLGSPMKNRPRGESDLGRAADPKSSAYKPMLESIPAASSSWLSLPEALTSLLIPLPYMLASAVYSSVTGETMEGGSPPLPAYARMQHGANGSSVMLPAKRFSKDSGLAEACALTAGTLLLAGLAAKISSSTKALDRRKIPSAQAQSLLKPATLQTMALRILSLALPFYSSMQIGGMRVGLILLASIAANVTCLDLPSNRSVNDWKRIFFSRMATIVVIAASVATDAAGWTYQAPFLDVLLGYLALACSVLLLSPPLPILSAVPRSRSSSKASTPSSESAPWLKSTKRPFAVSILAASPSNANITLIAGVALSLFTAGVSMWLAISPSHYSKGAIMFGALSIVAMAAATIFAEPHLIRSQHKTGFGLGCLVTASCAFLYSPSLWPGTISNGGLSALSFLAVLHDTNASRKQQNHDHHIHEHAPSVHARQHAHASDGPYSGFTRFMMNRCEPGSLVYGILSEKDSRRIAYFTLLNFAFMFVQGVYGYLSGSLGLLSDTVHMFFDCLGLVVGLGAAVASKWPTSPEKPYGWGKLNTLAGFGNGIFLMLVSVEFVWEAIEGIVEGTTLRHVKELLVVSSLGLMVNLVGLFAFGHAHAGHDHGHSHSHTHSPAHDHHDIQVNGHAHTHDCDHAHEKPQVHNAPDHHHNENMHGIFLHVAADAGGSLAVIISTALTLWRPWYLWDPLATIIIAVLIFAAAVPLVISSGQKLLLVIPDELEYSIKNTLQELGELRGVVGYAVPRFWVDDNNDSSDAHGHHHHGHDHGAAHAGTQKVLGVIHVLAAHSADLEDVRERVDELVRNRGMDLVIHVEREADGSCWCGGSALQKPG